MMTDRVALPKEIEIYEVGDLIESGWGWDVYEAYTSPDGGDPHACHLRVFFNQPENGLLHTRLKEAWESLKKHPHLHVQAITNVVHAELPSRVSVLLVEEELLKEWTAPKPSEYRAVMLHLLAAVDHLYKTGLPGIGLSGSNLARTRNGKAVLANLSSNWEQLWAGRSRMGESDYYLRLPPESANQPEEFNEPQWVWSAGSLLVEALSGMLPTMSPASEGDVFDTPISTYVNHQPDDFRESQLVTLPEDIQEILRTALENNPEDRFANLEAFSGSLETPIKTGKVGDRYVMPTARAIQDVAKPHRATGFAYGLGIAVFLLACSLAYYIIYVVPAKQDGATLVGRGPGVLLEPNTEWKTDGPILNTENFSVPRDQGRDGVLSEENMEVSDVAAVPRAAESPILDEKVDQRVEPLPAGGIASAENVSESPEPIDVPEVPRESQAEGVGNDVAEEPEQAPETLQNVDAGTELTPVVTEPEKAPPPTLPVLQESLVVVSAKERLLTETLSWQEAQTLLPSLSWDSLTRKDRKLILTQLDAWVIAQHTFIDGVNNTPERKESLELVQQFWVTAPVALRKEKAGQSIQKRVSVDMTNALVEIKNSSPGPITVYNQLREKVASLETNATTLVTIDSPIEAVSFLAEGATEWNQVETTIVVAPGGYFTWIIEEVPFLLATIVPAFDGKPADLDVRYAKHGEGDTTGLEGEVSVQPGDYSFFFHRPDYYSIKKVLRFSQGSRRYKLSLPSEDTWVATPALATLLEWEALLESDSEALAQRMKNEILPNLSSSEYVSRLEALQKRLNDIEVEKSQPSMIRVTITDVDDLQPPAKVELLDGGDKVPADLSVGTEVQLPNGEYQIRFTRPDYEPVIRSWELASSPNQAQLLLPLDSEWVESVSLVNLRELETAMKDKDGRRVVNLIQEIRRAPLEWPTHHQAYLKLRTEWYREAAGH